MKKVNLIIILIIAAAIGITVTGSRFGLEIGNLSYFFNSDKGQVYKLTEDFLEDIQFKDFEKAAKYHTPEDQKEANIPKLIEEKFKIKPEMMDIREIEVQKVEIDRSGDRARAYRCFHKRGKVCQVL